MVANNKPLLTGAIGIGVFGIGIGVGLILASFIVGLGTPHSAALSSTGTTITVAFSVTTAVLSSMASRARRAPEQSL